MDDTRPEVIVAATLYLSSGWAFDASPCACRVRAIVAQLERMMDLPGLDPVLRATALPLHASWHWVAQKSDRAPAAPTAEPQPTWH